MHRRGIGAKLLADLIERCRAIGYRVIVAAIDAEQPGSIELHQRYGFEATGRLTDVGFKFGRWLDVVFMQLRL